MFVEAFEGLMSVEAVEESMSVEADKGSMSVESAEGSMQSLLYSVPIDPTSYQGFVVTMKRRYSLPGSPYTRWAQPSKGRPKALMVKTGYRNDHSKIVLFCEELHYNNNPTDVSLLCLLALYKVVGSN